MKITDPDFFDSDEYDRFLDGWYSTGANARHSQDLKSHFDAIRDVLLAAGKKPRNLSWLMFGVKTAREWLKTHPKIR